MDEDKTTKYRRQIGRFRVIIALLSLISLILLVALVVVIVKPLNERAESDTCPSRQESIDLSPPKALPPFHDLTAEEILLVREFLYGKSDLNLVNASAIRCNVSYIFNIELRVPNKDITLRYLDEGKEPPPREAHVVVFRGDKQEPYVEEFIVGPLPNPIYIKNKKTFPFRYRPVTGPEMTGATNLLIEEVHSKAGHILMESYGGKLVDCEENCLEFGMITPFSSASSGEPITRKMWFWLTPAVEFWSLYPLDFLVLLDLTGRFTEYYKIEKIYHAGEMFLSLEALAQAYKDGSLRKTRIPYPDTVSDPFAMLTRHGILFPTEPSPSPIEFEPAGKRYSIKGRHVSYMGWDLDLRLSTISGPQLFDIRYRGTRIVYELSLQDIAVYYSAHNPANRFADYIDSIGLIGLKSRGLVAGSDCPRHSTFLSATHSQEFTEDPVVYERAFCVFEHDTAKPLRRHLSSSGKPRFYGGMSDITLTIRTIATIVNYDYVFDFVFHQNGAIEVSVVSTGYILTAFRFPAENPYGLRLRDHMTGSIHHHTFNFKVDMDINGRSNRFEALKISPKEVDNSKWSAEIGAKYWQTELQREHIKSEKQAAMRYNFSNPQYLVFYNNLQKTKYGVPKAYRLLNRGMSKNVCIFLIHILLIPKQSNFSYHVGQD